MHELSQWNPPFGTVEMDIVTIALVRCAKEKKSKIT